MMSIGVVCAQLLVAILQGLGIGGTLPPTSNYHDRVT